MNSDKNFTNTCMSGHNNHMTNERIILPSIVDLLNDYPISANTGVRAAAPPHAQPLSPQRAKRAHNAIKQETEGDTYPQQNDIDLETDRVKKRFKGSATSDALLSAKNHIIHGRAEPIHPYTLNMSPVAQPSPPSQVINLSPTPGDQDDDSLDKDKMARNNDMTAEELLKRRKEDKRRSYHYLPPSCVDLLKSWFDDNIDHPYPSAEEVSFDYHFSYNINNNRKLDYVKVQD
jgi:hypothetical protein